MKTSIFSLLFTLAFLGLSLRLTAGNGVINPNGTMDFSVNFRYPPTPADITRVRNALNAANLIICDATDGQLRFGTIRITAGAADEDEADIWVYAELGRSGVSFRSDGRSFGTLGAHVTLFQGGIDGGTIAHELGHLAFGLGDEYDEQCRWGGPCGIGPCFDAVGDNLMMQSGNQSELCVAGNHDLRRGNAACPTTVLCPGMGPCTDPNCALSWNSTTMRFELTQQSQIHPGLSSWETLDQNYPAQINPPTGLPTAAVPAGCGAPNIIEEVTGTEQIMLIIDRSGSMSARISADPASQTRMEFAKAAARAFVDLRAGSGARVGLVSFDDIPTLERNMVDLTLSDAPAMRTTIDNLSPRYNTAIGDALTATTFIFQAAASSGARTAFLLSDGQNTAGSDPRAAAQSLENQGVRIFTVPVGDAADRTLLSDIAAGARGEMLDAPIGDELPPIYFELAARSRGESIVLKRTPIAVSGRKTGGDDVILNNKNGAFDSDTAYVEFQVEAFSPRLNIMLSTRQLRLGDWKPAFVLYGPGGEVVTSADVQRVVFDPFYLLIRLQNPTAGRWRLVVASANGLPQLSYAIAHSEGPRPDFFVDAQPNIVGNATQPVTLSANAVYAAQLQEGVNFSGRVRRPDGSIVPVTFVRDPYTGDVSTTFNQFNYRGVYELLADCEVLPTAQIVRGEIIFSGPATPPFAVTPFTRSARAWFVLRTGDLPPCSNNDCDNDGIPNDRENPADLDFDGLPGDRDSDQDGDDIPDADESHTRDDDGDGRVNSQDPDANNNGILDGKDPAYNPALLANSERRLFFSVHVGGTQPLDKLESDVDGNIHAAIDLTYRLKSNLNLKAVFALHQFTAESAAAVQHPRWYSASANAQIVLPRAFNFKPYVQGGPGLYRDKSNANSSGFNLGIGGTTAINSETLLTTGIDYHQILGDRKTRFLSFSIGMLFR